MRAVTLALLKTVLILCAHRPGRSPSQRYRFEQYIPFLGSQGYRFTFSYLLNSEDDRRFYAKGKTLAKIFIMLKSVLIRMRDLRRFRKFDLIFIQREASFLGTSFVERSAFRSGARVIFDFDDSIWLADTSPGNKKWERMKKPEKFFTNLRYAHEVVAGNRYLAEKALPVNPHTVVIPTTVDTDSHFPKPELRNGNTVNIGWSGSISTVKHFAMLSGVLLRLQQKYKDRIIFTLMGAEDFAVPGLNLRTCRWTAESEVNILNSFDIGLMPLPDDDWSRGKCGLKALTYMACGIPVVASPVGVNTEIISHGTNGFLATGDEDWINCLSQLIEDAALREKTGVNARKTVVEHYSVAANRNKYLELFRRAEHATPSA